MKIGYFIPEFPGQTHAFFWREMLALQELGVKPDVVSTRQPNAGIAAHEWAISSAARTTYLVPLRLTMFVAAGIEILRAGPAGWIRVVQAFFAASDLSLTQRIRTLPLVFMGAVLARLARKRGWQQIHVHSCANAANVAMFANRLSGVKYSLTLHGPLKDYGPNQRNKWRHASAAVVITRQLLQEVYDQLDGNLPGTLRIAPMGVQVERFIRTISYDSCATDQTVRLVSCGRLNVCKGHDDLIRTVAILKQRGVHAELRIAGTTDNEASKYRKELRDLARVHAVASQVHLLGSISEDEVRKILSEAHVFALASLAEPLGVAIMEAMAMGVPVVVTRGGGVTELVRDGQDGILVDVRAPAQIADAVQRLLNNPEEARALGDAARQRIKRAFHHRISAETLAETFGIELTGLPRRGMHEMVSAADLDDLKSAEANAISEDVRPMVTTSAEN
ncbi:MAG: glycosyltransferase family 4 protein [Planctomycetota bacterium]|nr:glycosyltransferase family 4 protein [Planctomycetota bacterium]